MRRLRNDDGFTLIELMIVVVIIGILAAIAIPRFTTVSQTAKEAEADPALRHICQLAEAEFLRENSWTLPEARDMPLGWDDEGEFNYYDFEYASGTATAEPQDDSGVRGKEMDCATKVIEFTGEE